MTLPALEKETDQVSCHILTSEQPRAIHTHRECSTDTGQSNWCEIDEKKFMNAD